MALFYYMCLQKTWKSFQFIRHNNRYLLLIKKRKREKSIYLAYFIWINKTENVIYSDFVIIITSSKHKKTTRMKNKNILIEYCPDENCITRSERLRIGLRDKTQTNTRNKISRFQSNIYAWSYNCLLSRWRSLRGQLDSWKKVTKKFRVKLWLAENCTYKHIL